ncbi:unnamed protein product [Caretta caretta]
MPPTVAISGRGSWSVAEDRDPGGKEQEKENNYLSLLVVSSSGQMTRFHRLPRETEHQSILPTLKKPAIISVPTTTSHQDSYSYTSTPTQPWM